MGSAREIAKALIKKHEGLRLDPYKCTAGRLTIGYGRNLEDRGITLEEAEMFLNNDMDQIREELHNSISGYEEMPVMVKAVLYDMAYNLGISGLLKFKRFLAALGSQDYQKAAKEMMISTWARQVPKRAAELRDIIKSQH